MSVVVLRDPTNTPFYFGIDLQVWRTGPAFSGIGNIPAGLHLVTAWSDDTTTAQRSSLIFFLAAGETVVLKWDTDEEQLVPCDGSAVDQHARLAPYPEDINWEPFQSHIDFALLPRILPGQSQRFFRLDSNMSSHYDWSLLYDSETGLHFTQIDIKRPPTNMNSEDLTRFAFDKSDLLHEHSAVLLGEFQLAYLLLTASLNYSGLQHWKTIILLFCLSATSIHKEDTLFAKFMEILKAQMGAEHHGSELIGDLFRCDDTPLLVRHFHDLYSAAVGSRSVRLRHQGEALRNVVRAKYQWDLAHEPLDLDDELPAIVEETHC